MAWYTHVAKDVGASFPSSNMFSSKLFFNLEETIFQTRSVV